MLNTQDQTVRWTPQGYEHETCPTLLDPELHPSGFTKKQVFYTQLLVGAIKTGDKPHLVKCKRIGTDEEVTILALVNGHHVTPIALMFKGDGTDEVVPVVTSGEQPQVRGRKTNG